MNIMADSTNLNAGGQTPKKSIKQMTKAERREMQERQRQEKALRIAQGGPSKRPPQPPNNGNAGTNIKQNVSSGQSTAPTVRVSSGILFDNPKMRSKAEKQQQITRDMVKKPIEMFSHLPQYEKNENLTSRLKKQENIYPPVLTLGVRFSEFLITGGNARCLAMLEALKCVISDYQTPQGTSLPRHLPSVISKQVDFLTNTRVLSASMKTAIKFLKKEISVLPPDTSDRDAKDHLLLTIDEFIQTRIDIPGALIAQEVIRNEKIEDGDIILTIGKSSTVLNVLKKAKEEGINFSVIVVDSRPKGESKGMLLSLLKLGIHCTYIFINAVPLIIRKVNKVMIGCSSVLGNGAILSRVGTSVIALLAKQYTVPVLALCESYKFSEDVRLDSFTWNEIGNPDELLDTSNHAPTEILPSSEEFDKLNVDLDPFSSTENKHTLSEWRDIEKLKLLNLHYDVTPATFVTALVCEYGIVPSPTALMVLRMADKYS